jgi:glycosyltransferase involved in cell wall biosynthesis
MISVVIPLYNKAQTIERTVKSVLVQTFKDFELIIINDGSTDDGVNILLKSFKDPRIRIINQQNLGVSVARNTGVYNAQFEYVAFLDGDDEWLPDYLRTIVKVIALYPNAGMICCAGFIVNADGSKILRLAKKYQGQILEINYFESPGVFSHTSANVVSKHEFLGAGGFPIGMKIRQDFALFISIALKASVVYCGIPLSIYNGGVDGQTTSASVEKQFNLLKHFTDCFNYTFERWLNTGCTNKVFLINFKYELRHYFKIYLMRDDYRSITYLVQHLKAGKSFNSVEFSFYERKSLKYLAFLFILITKARWRLRGYPRFGEKL